jgi:hypothetical protein
MTTNDNIRTEGVVSAEFRTPPANQGQIVEVSYLCAPDLIVQRCYDRSDRAITYYVADLRDEDWDWYEDFDPGMGEPPLPRSRWRPIAPSDVDRLVRDAG